MTTTTTTSTSSAPAAAPTDTVEAREAAYWDSQAAHVDDDRLRTEDPGSDEFGQVFLNEIGDVRGKRVLDVGCGTGSWAVHMAKAGAEVWAVDISPQSVAVVRRRAELNAVADRVHASVGSATETGLPDAFFDLVYGQDIIHHLDANAFGREVARVLKPDGRACFSENSANNPLLMFARNHVCGHFGIPRWSSDDEYPLTRLKLGVFASYFTRSKVQFPIFVCFFYFDAKVFKYRSRVMSWLCRAADRSIHRLTPFLRRYSYRQLVSFEMPRSAESATTRALGHVR